MLLTDPSALKPWPARWGFGTDTPSDAMTGQSGPTTDVELDARLFELVAVTDGFVEACRALDVRDLAAIPQDVAAGLPVLVEHLTGYDPDGILREHAQLAKDLQQLSAGEPVNDTGQLFESLVYATRVLVAACPVDSYRERASTQERYGWFERLDRAWEVLRAFLHRNDPQDSPFRSGIARAFRDGRITLAEAAEYLGMSSGDAAAAMDALDMCRRPDAIRLGDDERAAMLLRIRKQRMEGAPSRERARELARRSAISSMRLEGVDARPWLPPRHE